MNLEERKGQTIDSRRIGKNTLMLYFRMLLKLLVSLYTSRVILDYLGVEDYGIYNVVGGIVALFSFITNSMTVSVQRYLSFELGRPDKSEERMNSIFSMAMYCHAIIAFIVILFSETLGLYFFNQLNIPENRIFAAQILYQISVVSSCVVILQIPHTALIIAAEKMGAYAYIGVLDVILKLLVVYLLPLIMMDDLISYGVLLLCVNIIITVFFAGYCRRKIPIVRFASKWNGKIFKELVGFSAWSFLVEISWTSVMQGLNMMLNIFFNPAVNAARAIALQVKNAVNQFVVGFQTALNPQIIKLYASEEKEEMYSLALKGTRFSYYLILLLSLPVIVYMDKILDIWLKEVPVYTVAFCRLSLVGSVIESLSTIFNTVIKATGKIRKYQIAVSICFLLNLPISYFLLKMGASPQSVYWAYIGVALLIVLVRVILVVKQIGLRLSLYVSEVVRPALVVTFFSVFLTLIVKWCWSFMGEGFILPVLFCMSATIIVILFGGMSRKERTTVGRFVLGKVSNFWNHAKR